MDSGARKCLPQNSLAEPQDEIDKQIANCLNNDKATSEVAEEYIRQMEILYTKGSALKVFRKYLQNNRYESLALNKFDSDKQLMDNLDKITVKECAIESIDMAKSVEENHPDKLLSYNKWLMCVGLNFCHKQIRQCLAKRNHVPLNDAWEKSSAIDVVDCLDDQDDPDVRQCRLTMERLMTQQMRNSK